MPDLRATIRLEHKHLRFFDEAQRRRGLWCLVIVAAAPLSTSGC